MPMVYGLQGFITTQYARGIMSWGKGIVISTWRTTSVLIMETCHRS